MKMNWKALGLAAALGFAAFSAQAEVTLKAASTFARDSFFDKRFENFVKEVNEEGKGILQINFVGGPESIPAFQVGNALRNGVVDLANATGVFHSNLVPEALVLSFSPTSMETARSNGGFELMNKIHKEKANMVWLGRLHQGLKYHIYTNKKPEGADAFKGMKLRSVPVYRSFFMALGAEPFQVQPGEVYTALERGQVDGYGWPSVGIFDLGWQEKTKYRVDPGFYNVEVSLFMNANTYSKLNDEQRAFLEKKVREYEDSSYAYDEKGVAEETKRLVDAGIEIVELPEAEAQAFVQTANEEAWKTIQQNSPKYYEELRKAFDTK